MTTVTITAGHGQYSNRFDCGACAKDGTTEASIATEMRGIVKYYLEQASINVRTDGIGDKNLGLNDAVKLISGCDVAIELHCNASTDQSAGGVEVLARPKDKKLAQDLSKAIADVMGNKVRGGDGGYRPENSGQHQRLAFVSNGGLIVEMFFISNPTELQTYRDKKWLIGKAIAGVLAGYVGKCLAI